MADSMQERGSQAGDDAGSAADTAAAAVSNLGGRIGEYTTQAKEYAQRGYRLAADKATKVKGNTEDYIADNPWYAVGIALGVGVGIGVLAALLLRSNSRRD